MTERKSAHVIVLGNEKGGSGKSTTAMHVVVSLLQLGRRVGAIDLDGRQRSLGRYIENRRAFVARKGVNLPMPDYAVVPNSTADNRAEAAADEQARFAAAFDAMRQANDFVVIDCPGSDTNLSHLGHAVADTLITPVNDSFVDLDLLADIDPDTFRVRKPSHYSIMVWEQRKERFTRDKGNVDWVVMRNRLSHLDARNKRLVGQVLEKLAGRIGYRLAPGFGERVIYRELFLNGLTLMDLGDPGAGVELTLSHVGARQEVRHLMSSLNLPGVDVLKAS
jgi:chromosome partitioning protein